jgi:DNA polymerase III delta prime subunit
MPMQQILTAIRMIPGAARVLAGLFIAIIIVLLLARPLGLWEAKWILIAGVVVIFGVFYLIKLIRKQGDKKKAKGFESDLGVHSRQSGVVSKEEIREALDALTERWELAVKELRESGISIYDIPWFLLIGEPQSGKSTTLRQSGIDFPVGNEALSGSGGTRNCDWWFTNEAVILDTAGRFSFQEANAPDQHEWNAFLRLLVKHRRQCPINGVIVVIPVDSMVKDDIDIQISKANNIRKKLQELQKTLGIRFPVTVLITKCDQILGFTEFFSSFSPAEEVQLFGWSSRASVDEAWDARSFDQHFEEIVARVHRMRLRLFHGESSTSKIDKLFVFPEELQALREPLARYLNEIFKTNRFEEPICLRGYYFTSGVQQGRPLALACRDLLRVKAGDPLGVFEDLAKVFSKPRAFFIRDFYEKKVFPEQGLVSRTRAAIQRAKTKNRILFGVAIPVAVIFAVLFILAGATLKATVGNINNTVKLAADCISGEQQCSVETSYELIESLTDCKTQLSQDRWALWMFWRGTDNQVNARYIPAVQGELFRKNVLQPLITSFEVRAGKVDWGESFRNYPEFHGGLAELLTFYQFREPGTGADRKRDLRSNLAVAKMVAFCKSMKGVDASAIGREIDEWLINEPSAISNANVHFRSILAANPRFVERSGIDKLPQTSIEAMRRYWTVENLARWDFKLTGYLKRYDEIFIDIERLMPERAEQRRRELDSFIELTAELNELWEAGVDHMASRSEAIEEPGHDGSRWVELCFADFQTLESIGEDPQRALNGASVCQQIPPDLREMESSQSYYDYLLDDSIDEEGSKKYRWAADAEIVKDAAADISRLADAEMVADQIAEFKKELAAKHGKDDQVRELNDFCTTQANATRMPIDSFKEVRDSRFHSTKSPLSSVAELLLAETVLPPAREWITVEIFPRECTNCFNKDYSDSYVTATNSLISWVSDELVAVQEQRETSREIDDINSALFRYLSDFIDRSGGGGGGGGTAYSRPTRATQTSRWPDFVDEVSRWRHLVTYGGSSAGTGELTMEMLQRYARANAHLQSLQDRLAQRQPQRSTSSGSGISESLQRAITRFRDCVSGLDSEPLKAWRQLVEEKKLDDFHSFSSDTALLRRDSNARWLANNLERHGAKLLVEAIEPDFQQDYDRLAREIDYCCRDEYPFISQRDLEDLQSSYSQGYGEQRYYRDSDYRDSDYRDRYDERDPPRYDRNREQRRSRRINSVWRDRHQGSGEITWVMDLPTADTRDLEYLVGRSGIGSLFDDYALEPILSGRETEIDFVGSAKETLKALQEWREFLLGRSGHADREDRSFSVRLLPDRTSRDVRSLHEGVPQVCFFAQNRDSCFRPSSDGTYREITLPLRLDRRPFSIIGEDEESTPTTSGWTSHLELNGDDLKLLYFIEIASIGRPSNNRTVWEILIEIPDYDRKGSHFEGIFELALDRPLPGLVPDARSYD